VPARSVAIVPGSPVAHGKPVPQLRARLETALALYRTGRVKAILVSGNDSLASPEVGVMYAFLLAHGVPEHDLWTDQGGSRTRETMRRAAGIYGVTDAIICTQELFMARSLYLARAAGIDAVGVVATDATVSSPRRSGREALKAVLAFVESQVREGPEALAGERAERTATVAAR
jgi:vancomycin permeability regulator SanA